MDSAQFAHIAMDSILTIGESGTAEWRGFQLSVPVPTGQGIDAFCSVLGSLLKMKETFEVSSNAGGLWGSPLQTRWEADPQYGSQGLFRIDGQVFPDKPHTSSRYGLFFSLSFPARASLNGHFWEIHEVLGSMVVSFLVCLSPNPESKIRDRSSAWDVTQGWMDLSFQNLYTHFVEIGGYSPELVFGTVQLFPSKINPAPDRKEEADIAKAQARTFLHLR